MKLVGLQFLTMLLKAKIRSINVSKKWKTLYFKSESKTSILLIYCEFFSYYQLVPLSIILCFLGIYIVEPKRFNYISGTLIDHSLSGPPKDHSLIASHTTEPHPTDQIYLDLHKSLNLNISL